VEQLGHISEQLPCPGCGGHTILRRHGQYGAFWGCTNYPQCDGRLVACDRCNEGALVVVDRNTLQCNHCQASVERCPKCTDGVCGECLVAYEDVGFAMFMCHEDRDKLEVYKRNPSTATRVYRDPWSAAVAGRHDEFINNDRHRVALQGKIERGIQNLEKLRVKLRNSEERAAAADVK
jgi:hypothetical protein